MTPESNHVSIGTNYGANAVGSNAQATQTNAAPAVHAPFADALAALRQAIEAADFPDKPRVKRDVDEIEAEVARPDADPARIGDALTRISARTAQIGGIATVVAQVWALVKQFIH
jgi:hypothetical protein